MGNYSEFKRVVDIVTTHANFDANINVSVFETNIRIVGGLLSAHLLSQRYPCTETLWFLLIIRFFRNDFFILYTGYK